MTETTKYGGDDSRIERRPAGMENAVEGRTPPPCIHWNIVIDTFRKEVYCEKCGRKFEYQEVEHVEQ